MTRGRAGRRTTVEAAVGAAAPSAALGLYHLLLRPWHLAYGATPEEARSGLPGDGLLPAPTVVSTRAITIRTFPERIWPWLVQMGKDRGGLYSYTMLENVFGLGIHNADRVIPELQDLSVGDRVPLSKRRFALIVRELVAPHTLVFEFAEGGWTWAFHLAAAGPRTTRLLIRNRWSSTFSGPARQVLFWALEPSAFVMEQRMLRGIKERAEASSA